MVPGESKLSWFDLRSRKRGVDRRGHSASVEMEKMEHWEYSSGVRKPIA